MSIYRFYCNRSGDFPDVVITNSASCTSDTGVATCWPLANLFVTDNFESTAPLPIFSCPSQPEFREITVAGVGRDRYRDSGNRQFR